MATIRQIREDGIQAPGAARRHSVAYSKFVQIAKVILPLTAFALICLIVAWPYLESDDHRFRIGFASVEVSEATDPSMVNARYVGTDNDNQPFSVTADIARQLDKASQTIMLEVPKADVTLNDGSWLVLTAETGIYDRDSNSLILDGKVNLFHDAGYEIHTDKADIDLGNGEGKGDTPVKGHGPFGRIDAEGFRLLDKGKTIIFTGKTHAMLYMGGQRKDEQ